MFPLSRARVALRVRIIWIDWTVTFRAHKGTFWWLPRLVVIERLGGLLLSRHAPCSTRTGDARFYHRSVSQPFLQFIRASADLSRTPGGVEERPTSRIFLPPCLPCPPRAKARSRC